MDIKLLSQLKITGLLVVFFFRDLTLYIRDLTQQAIFHDADAQLGCFGISE